MFELDAQQCQATTPQAIEQAVIERALRILRTRMRQNCNLESLSGTEAVKRFMLLTFGGIQNEQFGCLFLDSQHKMIEYKTMFFGTVGLCSVYPREIIKLALAHNATGLVVAHNHPAHSPRPSGDDMTITRVLRDALKFVDIVLQDHLILSGSSVYSMREHGDF